MTHFLLVCQMENPPVEVKYTEGQETAEVGVMSTTQRVKHVRRYMHIVVIRTSH